MTHPLGWPERPRAGSQFDSVLEEFTLEDAELVVEVLRQEADRVGPVCQVSCRVCDAMRDGKHRQLRLIANHLAMEVGKARTLAAKRETTPTRPTYMGFDRTPAAWQDGGS